MTAKAQPTNSFIRNLVYKTLCTFKNQKEINSIDFVTSFKLEKLIPAKDYIKFSNTALARSIILMKIKKLNQTKLVRQLKGNEDTALKMGFYRDMNNNIMIPNQRSFSHFIKHILDEKSKEIIGLIVDEVRSIAEKSGMIFDGEVYKSDVNKQPQNKFARQYAEEEERKKLYRLCKDVLMPCIRFPYLHHNTKYGMAKFTQLLIHMSLSNEFAEKGAEKFSNELERMNIPKIAPKGETLLYHIKKYGELCKKENSNFQSEETQWESLQNLFIDAFDSMFKFAKKRTQIFNGRKFDIAIDETEIPYYGDENDPMVVTKKKKSDGTTIRCFRFIVISIVNKGAKYILLPLPVGMFHKVYKYRIYEKLIDFAKKRIRIGYLYSDRDFSKDSKFLDLMNKLGIKYGFKYDMIGFKTSLMKKAIVAAPEDRLPFLIPKFKIADVETNLLIIRSKKEYIFKIKDKDHIERVYKLKRIAIVTNVNFENNPFQCQFWAVKLDQYYKRRWNIEIAFRDSKQFLARTTSKHYEIRYFYCLIAIILYNLWILAESLFSIAIYGKILEKSTSIKAQIFVDGLFTILTKVT